MWKHCQLFLFASASFLLSSSTLTAITHRILAQWRARAAVEESECAWKASGIHAGPMPERALACRGRKPIGKGGACQYSGLHAHCVRGRLNVTLMPPPALVAIDGSLDTQENDAFRASNVCN